MAQSSIQGSMEKYLKKLRRLKSRFEAEASAMVMALVRKTLSMYAAKTTLVSDGQSGSTFIIEWPFDAKYLEQE